MHSFDTIAALASATGRGARAIVRVSGKNALSVVRKSFRASVAIDLSSLATYSWCEGEFQLGLPAQLRIPVLLYWMAGPRSYTREDVVELHFDGSPTLVTLVLDELCGNGARLAEPGEFTRRAFLSGRIDLSQAEAVMGLICARNEREATTILDLLEGDFGRRVEGLREEMLRLLALLEASIDFSDQDIEIVSWADLRREVESLLAKTGQLLEAIPQATDESAGLPRVLLYGPTNAGKSSLFNALFGKDRALVSEEVATTREGVSAPVEFGSVPAMLRDSAGLTEADTQGDGANAQAVAMTRRQLELASIVLLVVDGSAEASPDRLDLIPQIEPGRLLRVINKCDQPPGFWRDPWIEAQRALGGETLLVSARTEEGLSELSESVGSRLASDEGGMPPALQVFVRHRTLLLACQEALFRAQERSAAQDPAELLAVDLTEACDKLSEITGQGTAEEVLDLIFSRFCIGK